MDRRKAIPPTKEALSQVVKRANYAALSWENCGQPFQTLPSPEQHGWIGEQFLPVACNTAPAPSSVLQLVKCSCKGSCATRVCSCKKKSFSAQTCVNVLTTSVLTETSLVCY